MHYIFRNAIPVHAALLAGPPVLVSALAATPGAPLFASLKLSFTAYLSTLVLSVCVYRLSPFHPLARYPGPLGCKLSKFWLAFVCVRGYQHRYIKSLHDRYGDVVRIGEFLPGCTLHAWMC